MTKKTMHIGFDDTDSPRKGCTTYVAALILEKLLELEVEFVDYPNLIRLNPNVPWKTRGNGALCIRIRHDEDIEGQIKETIIRTVKRNADLDHDGTDPGIVFFPEAKIPEEIRVFARKAISGIVTLERALRLLRRFRGEATGFKKRRGIIGGLAAVGEILQGDHTFEILAYRRPRCRGSRRQVDKASIFEMDETTAPHTFNNIDYETRRVLITPRGPDPILFGIRGETANVVKKAFEMVRSLEPVERWVIFRTNQGTDAHLKQAEQLDRIKPYNPVIVKGMVATNPRIIPRRHVIFTVRDEFAEVDCAAYEPTGNLRKAASKLIAGDNIEIHGGVRPPSQKHPLTINLEKIRVLKLAPIIMHRNPICLKCGKRLESMGRNKGFRCKKCASRYPELEKVKVKLEREIAEDLYITSPRSQRHLTKPIGRRGMEKNRKRIEELIEEWHFP